MKTLYLLRHAKSDQAQPVADKDRTLNARGRKACRPLGRHLKTLVPEPGLVFCSTAVRARETWEGVAEGGRLAWPVAWRDDLYLAPAGRLLSVAQGADDAHAAVIVVAHNPGLEDLAHRLAGPGSDAAAVAALDLKYPTGGLASIAFAADRWRDIGAAGARLLAFITPRDLGEA